MAFNRRVSVQLACYNYNLFKLPDKQGDEQARQQLPSCYYKPTFTAKYSTNYQPSKVVRN